MPGLKLEHANGNTYQDTLAFPSVTVAAVSPASKGVNRVVGQTRAGKMRSKGQCSQKKSLYRPPRGEDFFLEEFAYFLCIFTRCLLFFLLPLQILLVHHHAPLPPI